MHQTHNRLNENFDGGPHNQSDGGPHFCDTGGTGHGHLGERTQRKRGGTGHFFDSGTGHGSA